MKKRIAVVAFLLSMAVTSTAMADLSLGMGTRWTATRWYNPVWLTDVQTSGNHFINNSETALDAYFMLAFSKKFGLYLQIDYLSMSWACTGADNDDNACVGDDTGDMSFSSFGFELGLKYYFAEPRRAAISPMLTAGFFKYFASVTDGDAPADDQFALGDLSSPIGGRLAIGVEYNFSNNFSIGAEIFGLRIAAASTPTTERPGNDDAATIVGPNADTDYLSISMYTALTLNFRFYGLFRVYTREEEEQGRQEEAEDRQENQQWQQQQGQGWQQNQQNQQNQQWQQNQNQNQQWQQQQNPQWQQQQQNPNQQWQQQPQDPNQQWQQPQGGGTQPVQ